MNSGQREGLYHRRRTEVLRWSRNNSELDGGKLLKVWPLNQSSGPRVSGNHKELPKTELPMSLTCKGMKKKKKKTDDFWESYKQSSANGSFLEFFTRRVSELGDQKHVGWWEVSVFLTLALPSQASPPPKSMLSMCSGDPGKESAFPTPLHYALQGESGFSGWENSILGWGRILGGGDSAEGQGDNR